MNRFSSRRWPLALTLAALLHTPAHAAPSPLGTSAPKPQRNAQSNAGDNQAKTCASPQFQFAKWEGDAGGDAGGWPRILVLTGTSDPERSFDMQVCLPATVASTADGWSDTPAYPGATAPTHGNQHCRALDRTIKLSPPSAANQPATLRIPFGIAEFRALLAADGVVEVGYQTADPCSLDWDQLPLTVLNRNIVKLQAGLLYRLNDAGNWDNSGEAAVRFISRFTSMFEGEAEIRYFGVAASSKAQTAATPAPAAPGTAAKAGAGGDSAASGTFNPFSASKGVLQMNFTTAGYIFGRGQDLINFSWLCGAGATTLRAVNASASAAAADNGTTDTSLRAFAGLRLLVPSYFSDGVALTKPHSRVQVSLARDDAWRFTNASGGKVDQPNRLVTEGDFEFLEAKQNNSSNVLVGIHLRWDTPASFSGGTSDLRVSLLAAVNFFGF